MPTAGTIVASNSKKLFDVLQLASSNVNDVTGVILSQEFQKDESLQFIFMKAILQLIKLIVESRQKRGSTTQFQKNRLLFNQQTAKNPEGTNSPATFN